MRLAVITSGRIKMYGLQAPVLLAQPFIKSGRGFFGHVFRSGHTSVTNTKEYKVSIHKK